MFYTDFRKRHKSSVLSTQPPNRSNVAAKQLTSQSVKQNASTIRSLQVIGMNVDIID